MEGLEVNHISKDFLDTSGKTFHALEVNIWVRDFVVPTLTIFLSSL